MTLALNYWLHSPNHNPLITTLHQKLKFLEQCLDNAYYDILCSSTLLVIEPVKHLNHQAEPYACTYTTYDDITINVRNSDKRAKLEDWRWNLPTTY